MRKNKICKGIVGCVLFGIMLSGVLFASGHSMHVKAAEAKKNSYVMTKSFAVLKQINKKRAAAGVKPVSMDLHLYKTAKVRAKEIVQSFSHVRPNGTGCFTAFPASQISMGENLAQGYSTAGKAMKAWMSDPEHKATILNPKYTSVGIACYYVPGSKYGYYWVQCFGDTIDVNIYQKGKGYTIKAPTVYEDVDYGAVYDFQYYIEKYPSVEKKVGNNAEKVLEYFVTKGMKKGHQGCENFNVKYYKNRYVDLRNLYGNEIVPYYMHYITNGAKEGRDGKTQCKTIIGGVTKLNGVNYKHVYNYAYYLGNNEYVKENYEGDDIGALTYFVEKGMANGDQAKATFNVMSYAYKYYDLRKKYKNDLPRYYKHYMKKGKKAGLIATGTATMQGGPTKYKKVNYKAVFRVGYYAGKYPELAEKYGLNDKAYLAHFVKYGMKEGRQGSAEFNVKKYKKRYSDLKKAFGKNWESYYLHYINTGKAEGRNGK